MKRREEELIGEEWEKGKEEETGREERWRYRGDREREREGMLG